MVMLRSPKLTLRNWEIWADDMKSLQEVQIFLGKLARFLPQNPLMSDRQEYVHCIFMHIHETNYLENQKPLVMIIREKGEEKKEDNMRIYYE